MKLNYRVGGWVGGCNHSSRKKSEKSCDVNDFFRGCHYFSVFRNIESESIPVSKISRSWCRFRFVDPPLVAASSAHFESYGTSWSGLQCVFLQRVLVGQSVIEIINRN